MVLRLRKLSSVIAGAPFFIVNPRLIFYSTSVPFASTTFPAASLATQPLRRCHSRTITTSTVHPVDTIYSPYHSTTILPRRHTSQFQRSASFSSTMTSTAERYLAQIKPVAPTGKYPAKDHARRVIERMKKSRSDAGHVDGIALGGYLYLEGQKSQMQEDSDQSAPFRQRRYFYYLTGCELPDCYAMYNIAADWLTLFIPPVDAEQVMWAGMPLTEGKAIEKYDIDECVTTDKLNEYLNQVAATANASPGASSSTVYAIDQQQSDHVKLDQFDHVSINFLRNAIEECRVVKDDYELDLIRYANAVSSIAHINVIRSSSEAVDECGLEAVFFKHCIERHCRKQSYDCIVASGTSAATLHYVDNEAPMTDKLNVLVDAGGEFRCYASDITRTVPLGGKKFTTESRAIYEAVEEMQDASFAMVKAGMVWDDVHAKAHRVAVQRLTKLGILYGGTEDEIFDSGVSTAFFPHGLGHYMGMDTHDCGGKADYSDPNPMFRYLRVRGPVPAGAVITVEPGIYFSKNLIGPYLEDVTTSRFIDRAVLDRYWTVGGVRIEDDVVVTVDGYENMTKVPRAVDEIEAIVDEGRGRGSV